MDLSSLSMAELHDLEQRIPQEMKRREVLERVDVLNEVRALAKARGYALEELVGKEIKVKSPTVKVKVKYRHPHNASLEWTGRGRKPKWVESWINEGKSIEALAV